MSMPPLYIAGANNHAEVVRELLLDDRVEFDAVRMKLWWVVGTYISLL